MPASTPPQLQPIGDKTASVGQKVHFFVKATGGQGGLTFSVSPMLTGATLEEGGSGVRATFDWVPKTADIGARALTFTAEDEYCQRASQTITITVNP
ncbi:MAG: hypothetical protein HY903_16175 [Deltaproteobacteria bacterium]|nr:hypothetical protein [Deltaproteobacteria bacterium]